MTYSALVSSCRIADGSGKVIPKTSCRELAIAAECAAPRCDNSVPIAFRPGDHRAVIARHSQQGRGWRIGEVNSGAGNGSFPVRRGGTAPVRRLNALRCRGMRMFPEEPQHLSSGIWAARIGVGAHCATAKPGVTSAVDNPLLNDRRPFVSLYSVRLNVWPPGTWPFSTCGLSAVVCPDCDHNRLTVFRIDRGIPVAMKHNSRNDPF